MFHRLVPLEHMTDMFLLVPTRPTGTSTRTEQALGVQTNVNLRRIIIEHRLRIDTILLEHSKTRGQGVRIVLRLLGQIVGLQIYGKLIGAGTRALNDLLNRLKHGSRTTARLVAAKTRK